MGVITETIKYMASATVEWELAPGTYTFMQDDDDRWEDETLVVRGDVVIDNDYVGVHGTVNLILEDGASLTVSDGIYVPEGESLYIYGQKKSTGTLTTHGEDYCAGIGTRDQDKTDEDRVGVIGIFGGSIWAYGGDDAAGIGGGNESHGGDITIGGSAYVTAYGGSHAAGIGGGDEGDGGNITINSGEVWAHGGTQAAGIGGGEYGDGASLTINGGEIWAFGGDNGAGIGGGDEGYGGNVLITDGFVRAVGQEDGAGIGGGWGRYAGNIVIRGGDISAQGGKYASGIGGGYEGGGGYIEISGGYVVAWDDGGIAAGIGPGYEGSAGTFSTGTNGNAIILTRKLHDKSNQSNWSGIIFDGANGRVYGNQTIYNTLNLYTDWGTGSSEKVLTIPANTTLTLSPEGEITGNAYISLKEGGRFNPGVAPIDNNIKLRFNVSLQRASGFEWATTTDAWCTPTGWSLDYSSPIMNGETPPPYLYPTAHGEICEGYSWSKEAGVLSVPFRSISGNLTVRAEDSHSLVYNSCRWTDDAAKPGEYSAVLTFRCSGCNEVVERNATVTHETLIAPTCTATGTERYYARYDGTIHDIKEVKGIPPKGHRYGNPTWAWNEIDEEKGVMLTLTCSVCNENESGYQTVLWVEPTFEVTLTPTCSTLGQGHYTASYSGAEGAYSGSHWVSIDYAPHNWDKSKWAYDENYHMHRCKDCHSVTDKAGHSYQNGSCTVCGVAEGTTFFTVKLFYDDSATPLRTEQLVRESVFTLPTYDNLSIPEDATFTPPAGKRLSGWKVVNGDIYNATAVNTQNFSQDEISLEAIWVDWEEFKVMLHSNNGGSLEESTTVKYGDKFTLPSCPFNPPEENMRFARWARNANGEGPISANELTIKANTDIYAIWENIPTYTVNFDSNGGVGTMNKATVYEGDWYDIPACEFNAPDNMRFDYWAYDEEGNDPANVSPICITDNITLFAIWENIPDLLISFNSNSGSGEMEEINLPYSVASAGGYALPPCSFTPPARSVFAGWSFTGGTTAGKVMAPDECITITSNTTLYAVWQALSDVTISFDKNNSDATGEMSPRHVPFDVEISLPSCTFGAPYGYQFAGWSLTSDGLILETEKLLANENITLYAIWETIPAPTIYFNPNGGAGAMSPVKVASYGTDYIVPKSSDYHYDGHFFVGYSLTPNGSLVTTLENVEKNITLYTIWTDKENPDIIEGNKQRVIKGGTAQFVSDAPFLWFLGVMVDDVALTEPEDFTAAEGSTKITLTKEFTNELSFGKHTIEIHSVSGVAKGTFTIVSPNENITPIDNGERDKKTGEGISTDEPPKAEPKKAPATKGEDNEIDENPVTGGSNAPSGGAPQSGAPQSPTEGDKGAPTTESGGEPKAEGDSLSPDYTPDNKPEIITEPEPLPTKPIKGESEVNPIIWVVAVIAVSAFVLFLIFRRKKSKK